MTERREWTGPISASYDVVVVGSGAAGLTAALAARDSGASVLVLEKAPFLGGTSAVSGGMLWIPGNRYLAEIGRDDDREKALRYLTLVTGGRTDRRVLESLVDRGDELLGFFAERANLRFCAMEHFLDYHPEWDGAHSGGRSLDPLPFDVTPLGALRGSLRPDPRPPFTMVEYEQWRIFTRFPWDELADRAAKGLVARGLALVAPLVKACADSGVSLVTGQGAQRLLTEDGSVTGVMVDDGGRIDASHGVVLACGGFEWSREMTADFLPGPVDVRCSPPYNTGDGIRMAAKAGAALGNMNEAWWGPMAHLPADETDGSPRGTILRFERTGPHSVIVNRAGRRFVNEAHNYNDMTKAFHAFDPRSYGFTNLPAYLIFDERHLANYGFLSHRAGEPTPSWLVNAPTLEDLAHQLEIDMPGLMATIDRFNINAREGRDPDFHRGSSAYDSYWGDQHAAHPALGPVQEPPFYAIEVRSGVLGTKGGIVTDANAQALDPFGEQIPGLYAVGNTTSHPMGPGYPGAGATLGPGCTMGYLAGRAVAHRANGCGPNPANPRSDRSPISAGTATRTSHRAPD
jgi:succinate dehydrogenase/fumarate reductase flavoprotein subunit